jgi:cobalamin synthase
LRERIVTRLRLGIVGAILGALVVLIAVASVGELDASWVAASVVPAGTIFVALLLIQRLTGKRDAATAKKQEAARIEQHPYIRSVRLLMLLSAAVPLSITGLVALTTGQILIVVAGALLAILAAVLWVGLWISQARSMRRAGFVW